MTISLDFHDGLGPADYTSLLRKVTRRRAAFTESYRHAVSSAKLKLGYDVGLLARFQQASSPVSVVVQDDGLDYFTGQVPPTTQGDSQGVDGGVSDLDLEVLDSTPMLDEEIKPEDEVAWVDHWLFSSADPANSIIHKLLAKRGITSVAVGEIAVLFTAFSADSGTFLSVIEEALLQHGYGFTFDASAQFVLVQARYDAVPEGLPIVDGDADLLEQFSFEQIEREGEVVDLTWWSLKSKADAFVYVADLPWGDNAERSGQAVQRFLKWPEEANLQETWWEYQDSLLDQEVVGAKTLAERTKKTGDFTQLVLTANHQLISKQDPEITVITVFQNKRARVEFTNTAGVEKLLWWCNIKADVVYRAAANRVVMEVFPGGTKVQPFEARYIHTIVHADRYAAFLTNLYKVGNWRYTFRCPNLYTPGTLLQVQEAGIDIDVPVMILSVEENPETEEYRYRAVGIGPAVIGSLARKATLLEDRTSPPKQSQKFFTTYHDNPAGSAPAAPTGDGNQNGWHSNLTPSAVWKSTKYALTPEGGAWSPAVSFQGPIGPSPYLVLYEWTNGKRWRPGTVLVTTIKAHVWDATGDVTSQIDSSRFRWRRVSKIQPAGDDLWDAAHAAGYKQIPITITSKTDVAGYYCDIQSV